MGEALACQLSLTSGIEITVRMFKNWGGHMRESHRKNEW